MNEWMWRTQFFFEIQKKQYAYNEDLGISCITDNHFVIEKKKYIKVPGSVYYFFFSSFHSASSSVRFRKPHRSDTQFNANQSFVHISLFSRSSHSNILILSHLCGDRISMCRIILTYSDYYYVKRFVIWSVEIKFIAIFLFFVFISRHSFVLVIIESLFFSMGNCVKARIRLEIVNGVNEQENKILKTRKSGAKTIFICKFVFGRRSFSRSFSRFAL